MNTILLLQNPEQWLVALKQSIVSWFPAPWNMIVSIVLSVAPILGIFSLLFAVTTLVERKGLGRIQNRLGPNRTGPFGILQPVADGVKMLIKEDIVPNSADRVVHFLAPIVLVAPIILALSVLPYGKYLVPLDLDAGILFFFAMGASSEVAVFMAGWSSRNKYSVVGAMRAIAQMISYELPLVLSSVVVIMMTGSLSLVRVVEAQTGYWGFIPQWHVFTPWGLAGFLIFLVAAIAESNRSPFDLPEAESEIIAGHLTEYSGFKYAVFFMGEYFGMMAVSGLAITLFLGGWHAPLPLLGWVPSFIWFFLKLIPFLLFFIWIRGTLPRLRADQLMDFAWKFLLPMTFLNIGVAIFWRFSLAWDFALAPVARWLLAAAFLAFFYGWLGSRLAKGNKIGPRVYRYAS